MHCGAEDVVDRLERPDLGFEFLDHRAIAGVVELWLAGINPGLPQPAPNKGG